MSSQETKLCLSFFPGNIEETLVFLEKNSAAELFELRLDRDPDYPLEKLPANIRSQLIVTCRSREEGGECRLMAEEKTSLFSRAISIGIGYIDVEWKICGQVLPKLPAGHATKIILSHHCQEKNFTKLWHRFSQMTGDSADIYKLIFRADTLADAATALRLQEAAKSSAKHFVIHAMGEAGRITRILGAFNGNSLTYVTASAEKATAAGQVSLNAARNIFRLGENRAPVHVLGLIGNPIGHSKGWRLHNELIHRKIASNKNSKNFIYLNFPVENLDEFWSRWKNRVAGLSVTLPFKKDVVKFLDYFSPEVRQSGVCNTMVVRNGKWCGYNTDLIAIKKLLEPYRQQLSPGALVIGTGGTARSALAALRLLEIPRLCLTGRNNAAGKMLAGEFNAQFVPLTNLDDLQPAAIIQTTPVGMFPKVDELPPASDLFKSGMVVLDAVYNPVQTRFLQKAQKAGCLALSGLEMFLRQAALQFELFTGYKVNVAEIREIWNAVNLSESK